MKIYSKKRLWSGVGLLVLAALLLVTMCIKGFRAKSVALVVVLVAIGLGELGSAMSRQQAIEDREERTAFIESKARSRAFSLTQQICLVLTIVLVVAGAVKTYLPLLAMGVATGLILTLSTVCEIAATIYYEKRY